MTKLLNDDNTASMATLMMCSHHAFRRDLACFVKALETDLETSLLRAPALREEWGKFRAALHGHHTVEDTGVFPDLRARFPELAGAIDELAAQHEAIDPLLERGDRAFASLRDRAEALAVVRALCELLAVHLELEERVAIPHLRGANEFPAPPNDDVLAMYAEGFAWSSAGIAPSVLEQVFALLPQALRDRLPAARRTFDERCIAVWGYRHTGESQTSVP